ncbi:MAG: hypothetical protein JST10_04990 [Bacteroidetes bacterium]|nr:hypothetical protein [Bacteroidota bacterium]MBS1631910.1 hypothetical protein [Bacteroidota bacterium]
MKKIFLILTLLLLSGSMLRAQEEEDGTNDKIRDKMTEFIQRRLNLSKGEAEKFSPVFLRYFHDWRSTLKEFKGNPDRLLLQQKIVNLRLRYRDEFKGIVGDKRSNQIFIEQQRFVDGVRKMRENQQLKGRPNRRFRAMMQ